MCYHEIALLTCQEPYCGAQIEKYDLDDLGAIVIMEYTLSGTHTRGRKAWKSCGLQCEYPSKKYIDQNHKWLCDKHKALRIEATRGRTHSHGSRRTSVDHDSTYDYYRKDNRRTRHYERMKPGIRERDVRPGRFNREVEQLNEEIQDFDYKLSFDTILDGLRHRRKFTHPSRKGQKKLSNLVARVVELHRREREYLSEVPRRESVVDEHNRRPKTSHARTTRRPSEPQQYVEDEYSKSDDGGSSVHSANYSEQSRTADSVTDVEHSVHSEGASFEEYHDAAESQVGSNTDGEEEYQSASSVNERSDVGDEKSDGESSVTATSHDSRLKLKKRPRKNLKVHFVPGHETRLIDENHDDSSISVKDSDQDSVTTADSSESSVYGIERPRPMRSEFSRWRREWRPTRPFRGR